jgi:hypothetical protein
MTNATEPTHTVTPEMFAVLPVHTLPHQKIRPPSIAIWRKPTHSLYPDAQGTRGRPLAESVGKAEWSHKSRSIDG